jgi:branched-chain amino acid transport system substrate-binding protein
MKHMIDRRDFLKIMGTAALGTAVAPFIPRSAGGALDRDYVHFGGSLPLTGPLAKIAQMYKDGYDFYLETVNHKIKVAGKTYDLKFTIYDDENKPAKTAQLTEKLIVSDKADLLLSAYGTDPVIAQGSVCEKYKRILLNGGAATRRLEEEFSGTVFTLIPTGDYYHRTLIDMVAKLNPPIRTAGIITPDETVYREIADAVRTQCEGYGIKILAEDLIPMDTIEMGPTVLKMKRSQVDMVVNAGWDKLLAGFVSRAREYKISLKFLDGGYATMTPFLKQSLGAGMKHIVGATFFLAQARTKDEHYGNSMTFAETFKKKYGYEPDYHTVLAYMIPGLYEVLLKDANPEDPFNPDDMRKRLLAMDRDMLWGRVRFNEKGRIIKDMLVIQWQGDPPEPVIVYPPENATGELIYPSDPLAG